jgi:hypothetical protein
VGGVEQGLRRVSEVKNYKLVSVNVIRPAVFALWELLKFELYPLTETRRKVFLILR